MIYLDNGATTFPKPDCVYDAVDRYARESAVNAGRGAYRAARESGRMIQETRDMLISLVDAREQAEVVLTPSVTIALNQIIHGLKWSPDSVAYVSPYEHNAVLRPLELLRRRIGFTVKELPLAADLSIDLAETERMFDECPPDFVAVSAVSNVTGYILPEARIFALAKRRGAFTLLDGSQAVGLLKMRFSQLRADVLCFAGHKTLYGPFGAAGFFIKNGVELEPLLAGGTGTSSLSLDMPSKMPGKMECGSKDTVAICGLHAALGWLQGVKPMAHERELMDYLMPRLRDVPGIHIYAAPDAASQAGVVSLNIEGFKCNETAAILDDRFDIAVRAGHHCAALIHSHLDDDRFAGTVRVSLSCFTTRADIDALIEGLGTIDRAMLKDIDENILRGSC